ncbi:MAG TPA: protein-glutamate O-methyltransferase [Candidatus Sulfopaludibacter sp.]|jgi:chemotaxis protein methyltransferase CheR|nr:protein-glutamate O-methyltransferase [Candidatus Sulfopaludibacter sp.]
MMTATTNEGLSSRDFERLRSLIYSVAGIHLTPEKKTMVEIRLKRRLRSLNLTSCKEYCDYVFGPDGEETELVHLIDAVTTNKTDFFREANHFDYLLWHALPDLAAQKGNGRKCRVWSAGCSTGEEPYTLGIVLSEYGLTHPGFRFSILATDICTEVLGKAAMGIFKAETVRPVPQEFRQKYFMRSRDPDSNLLRVVPELRSLVDFRRVNFMDSDFGVSEPVEIVFCRNVIIYFDRPTQVRILEKLVRHLMPGGYFFAGHSESLQGMELPLQPVAPAIFRKRT